MHGRPAADRFLLQECRSNLLDRLPDLLIREDMFGLREQTTF
jgi:hypothetical protein